MTTADLFLQMTFVSSRPVEDDQGTLFRIETRTDELTGLKLTRRFPVPTLPQPPREHPPVR